MKLTFDPGGTIHTLYDENIDLRALGSLTMRRATQIEFNEATQQWEVRDVSGTKCLHVDPSRAACLQWERENLI